MGIKRGETIVVEKPLFRFPKSKSDKYLYLNVFKKLSQSQQSEILQLENCQATVVKDECDSFLKIMKKYRNNSFVLGTYPPYNYDDTGFFKDINMFNHSCIPNAETHFLDPEMRVFAIQNIAKGAKICIEYYEMTAFDEPPTIEIVKQDYRFKWS